MTRTRAPLPALAGVVSAAQVAQTAAGIVAVQQPDGGIPWVRGGHIDAWNHLEAAMALLVGGEVDAAEAALEWCLEHQRPDGSWPMKVVGTRVEDASGDTNQAAYLAVAVWHHWLVRGDLALVRRCWPAVRDGLDFAVSLQLPFGAFAWSRQDDGVVNREGLVAGTSSIHLSLRAGLALAEVVGDPQPVWELAAGRAHHALDGHEAWFLDKSQFSMDWYYPVLAGPLRGRAGRSRLDARWSTFVEEGVGCRCVSPNPWVTGAETSELVLALDNLGQTSRAAELLSWIQHSRDADGMYWTGWVFDDQVFWPQEHTTFTAAAVILAVDALSRTTSGSGIFRGDSLPEPRPIAVHCGCEEVDARASAGVPGR